MGSVNFISRPKKVDNDENANFCFENLEKLSCRLSSNESNITRTQSQFVSQLSYLFHHCIAASWNNVTKEGTECIKCNIRWWTNVLCLGIYIYNTVYCTSKEMVRGKLMRRIMSLAFDKNDNSFLENIEGTGVHAESIR